MKKTGLIAYLETKELMGSRQVIILLFVMPLLLIFILGTGLSAYFPSGQKAPDTIRLVAAEGDEGTVLERLRKDLPKAAGSEQFEFHRVPSREEAEIWVSQGKADLGLWLPAGFDADLEAGHSPKWELIFGNELPKNVIGETVLESFFGKLSLEWALGKTLGGQVKLEAATGKSKQQPEVAEGIHPERTLESASLSASQYYSAQMLIMFLLYSGMSAALSLVHAKENRTLLRLRSMPVNGLQILMGKAAGNFIVSMLQAFVIIGVTAAFYGVNWGGSFSGLLAICFLTAVFSVSLAIAVGTLAKSTKTVMAFFQTVVIVITFLSGGFSPEIGSFFTQIGMYTVSYWSVQGIFEMMMNGGSAPIAKDLAVLSAYAAGMLLVGAAAYGRLGYRE